MAHFSAIQLFEKLEQICRCTGESGQSRRRQNNVSRMFFFDPSFSDLDDVIHYSTAKRLRDGQERSKTAQGGLKTAQQAPKKSQEGSKRTPQDGPKRQTTVNIHRF